MEESTATKLRIKEKKKQLEKIQSNLQDYLDFGSSSPTISTVEGRNAALFIEGKLKQDISELEAQSS